MKGKYHIEISNRKLHYELDIERKVTVIKGNSGTGKTTLIRMVQGYQDQGNKSGIRIVNEKNVILKVFVPSTNWDKDLEELHDHIIFVDEAVDYLYTKAFQVAFTKSDNYIVIISRSGKFTHIPYSVQSIYQFKSEKNQVNTVTKMYKIYHEEINSSDNSIVITEDENSGKEMMEHVFLTQVISANGNGNIALKIMNHARDGEKVISIVDGAAFGGFIAKTLAITLVFDDIKVFAPESFEYLLLSTDMFKNHLSEELARTYDFCDAVEYLTWEQYYTVLLRKLCKEYYKFDYTKSKLNDKFINNKVVQQVKQQLERYCITEE